MNDLGPEPPAGGPDHHALLEGCAPSSDDISREHQGQMNEAESLAFSAREPQRLARRTRRRQGLPETVTDPRAIARIVLLLTSGVRHVGDATLDGPGSAEETGPHLGGRNPNRTPSQPATRLNVG